MENEHRRSNGRTARLASMPVVAVMAVIAGVLLSVSPVLAQNSRAQDSVVDTALRFFTRHEATAILERLDSVRPVPLSTAQRELVLATLPSEGEVPRLNAVQRQKLAALRPVLEVHEREAVYVVKVVDVTGAFVGLHARTVLLVSEMALDQLDAAELQAFVAHEIGHEYFWNDYVQARRDDDQPGLRRLELLCDGVAIVTLRRAGTDPAHLTKGLEKVVGYNRARFGAPLNEDQYPAIGDRRTFGRRLVAWLGRGGGMTEQATVTVGPSGHHH
jgi:hypothetical protein